MLIAVYLIINRKNNKENSKKWIKMKTDIRMALLEA